MCYERRQLDWLPVRWRDFKHVHMVIRDGHGQKVPFGGGMCGQAAAESERGIWKKERWVGTDIISIIMVASITPYARARYQHLQRAVPHNHPSAKGLVLWASMHLARDVLRGNTMKQSLKNVIASLVGDLIQAAGVGPCAGGPRNALTRETSSTW